MSVFFFIIVIVGLVTGGEIVSKYLDQRAQQPAVPPVEDGEVARLREQVDYLAGEVERLSEEQRFMTRLLEGSGRSTGGGSDPAGG